MVSEKMKSTPVLLILQLLVVILAGSRVAPVAAENMVSLRYPPASLEQWYKPANKRQVWLHTMFRLRREMQAIAEYAETDDRAAMEKWIEQLDRDYNSIAEMVPEWKDGIKPRLLDDLSMFAGKGDSHRVAKTLKMIERTCDDCHTYYQPLVTAIYRSPYYDDISVQNDPASMMSFEESMEQLSASVNRVVIALDDDRTSVALQASRELLEQLEILGGSCDNCHKADDYPKERILGKATSELFAKLQTNIGEGRVQESQKLMGEIAVSVCARCHNIHRISSDLRNALLPEDE